MGLTPKVNAPREARGIVFSYILWYDCEAFCNPYISASFRCKSNIYAHIRDIQREDTRFQKILLAITSTLIIYRMAKTSVIARANKKPKFSTRKVNRCFKCGRKRGFMRDFALCRTCFRELANEGMIPGIKKASW